jgi:hypothetical protein
VPEPGSAVVVPAGDWVLTVRSRARETGMYQGAPYVDEWKPLPPRLHDVRTLQRHGTLPAPVAVAVREVSNAEFLASIPLYEQYVSELAEQGVDVILLTGAPPFMLLGPEKEAALVQYLSFEMMPLTGGEGASSRIRSRAGRSGSKAVMKE